MDKHKCEKGINIITSIKSKFLDLSISAKIIVYYFVVLVISLLISRMVYQQVFSEIISSKVGNMSIQMLQSINANFNSMVQTTGEYSKIITSNEVVQDTLANSTGKYDYEVQHRVNSTVMRLIGESSIVESAYIFDDYGNEYNAYNSDVKSLNIGSIKQAKWYKEVRQRRGGYVIRLNADNIFIPDRCPENYITLIREIEDLRTQKRIGVLIINASSDALKNTYKYIANSHNTGVVILDGNNNMVVNTADNIGFDILKFAKKSSSKETNWVRWKHKNTEYLVSYIRANDQGWKIISIIPDRELSKESSIFGMITIAVLAVNTILLFFGSVIISRLITDPIKKLLKSMKGIEKGEFKRVEIKAGNDEIGKLKDGYNTMIEEIQNLIEKIVEEQKIKRKIELDSLQAQIKPHFLYNTFDAVSSLALSGKSKDVYTIVKALGNFYRTNLSKGNEIITIGEEIEVVVSYLIILKYRYEDMFTVEYDVDEEVKQYKILKLVLQPFVENAIYHGIRPKGSAGKITISAKKEDSLIRLCIEDDGLGMNEETAQSLLQSKISYKKSGSGICGVKTNEKTGFGICGTIERLRIFYGIDDIVEINSSLGNGTKVVIKIPLNEEHLYE